MLLVETLTGNCRQPSTMDRQRAGCEVVLLMVCIVWNIGTSYTYSADLCLGPCSPSMLVTIGNVMSFETLGGQPQDDCGIVQVLCILGTNTGTVTTS